VTATATTPVAPPDWCGLLPPGTAVLALPTRQRPWVLAEDCPEARRYVRTALLSVPPGLRLPRGAWSALEAALRVPAAWRVLPRVVEPSRAGASPAPGTDGDWRRIVLRHSKDPDGSVLVLLFGPGDRWPRRAVKVAGRDGAARLGREAAMLRALADLGGRLADRVPRVLGLHEQRDRVVLVTPGQPGVPMLVRYHRPGHTSVPGAVRADLRAAEAWLARLHADTAGPRRPLDVPPGAVDRLLPDAATDPTAARALEGLAAVRRRLGRHTAPTAVVHGDFWAGNVLVEHGAVSGVVDWERAELRGGPLRDAARFAMTYCYYLDRHTRAGRRVRAHRGLVAGDQGHGVSYGLDGSGWFPDAVGGFLSRAATRAGVPPACARDAVLAEIAATAGEASDLRFRRSQLALFVALSAAQP
jgi:hypothetical protein